MNRLRKFWRLLGPGFVTGSTDDDPSGIATYSQAGAEYGYQQLWTALWLYPLVGAVQEICGRIGMVTGRGLMTVLREHYPRWVLWFAVALLVTANTVNVGADLGAMASTSQLLVGHGPLLAWMLIVVFCVLILQILVPYPLSHVCGLSEVGLPELIGLRRGGVHRASGLDADRLAHLRAVVFFRP